MSYQHGLKRLLDLFGAGAALLILFPLLLLLTFVIRLRLGAPALFRQKRPGLHGQPFTLYKFRTMNDARDSQGNLLPDEKRLTPFGRFLRSTSLDELPELINVLRGEMSLVGPRPLLMEYLDLYSAEQMRRHLVRPGITGWAQINGRNDIEWQEKFELDVWYVDNVSLWLDIKIVTLTLWKTVLQEGINQPGEATVQYFQGND